MFEVVGLTNATVELEFGSAADFVRSNYKNTWKIFLKSKNENEFTYKILVFSSLTHSRRSGVYGRDDCDVGGDWQQFSPHWFNKIWCNRFGPVLSASFRKHCCSRFL